MTLPPSLHDTSAHAIALLRGGRFAQAEPLLQQIIALQPDHPDALHGLAIVAHQQGRIREAEHRFTTLIKAHPQRINARYDLACILIEQQRDADAIAQLTQVVTQAPDHAHAWFQLGFAYKQQHAIDDAQAALHRCLTLMPHHAGATNELARLHRENGDYPAALHTFEQATRSPQAGIELYHAQWQFLSTSRLPRQALAALQPARARFAQSPDLWIDLGQAEEELGHRESAQQAYQQALALDPNRGAAIGHLLGLLGQNAAPELIQRAQAIMDDPRARAAAKALIGYGLGKVYHAQQQPARAFAAWSAANQARRSEAAALDVQELNLHTRALQSQWTAEAIARLSAAGSTDARPLLIVGMPRSGTTLTEQILAAHPDAEGLGELPDLAIIAERFRLAHGDAQHWPVLSARSAACIAELAAHYQRVLDFRSPGKAQRLIDKTPLNSFNIGLFAAMFPQARFVWCRRDPRDVGLSIYGENFAPSQRYATDLTDLARYMRAHDQVMHHWQNVLPERVLALDYAALVSDPEPQTRRLLAFVGLSWDARCLNFHQSARAVQTPSRWQVRQPIYTRAIGRWRAYQPWLKPLLDAFGEEDVAV
ncbi:sulfotransferase [Sinimarinibacterium sp. NLF-5-8]|uniref:tetratricopeptide repeat-containing sulfotransferase family protein n=1 Tax=Sinimarinibacterium sp. NLF-5-8 TaxID=2698684 RepID=UPI00137C2201|nr:sulfotransferase [Sinimarinibacterium sp. NLF-5-8]QHS08769.1 tetratricopeptide repeat protein [Sinimarinibacterium sp. NLF-5-8]